MPAARIGWVAAQRSQGEASGNAGTLRGAEGGATTVGERERERESRSQKDRGTKSQREIERDTETHKR